MSTQLVYVCGIELERNNKLFSDAQISPFHFQPEEHLMRDTDPSTSHESTEGEPCLQVQYLEQTVDQKNNKLQLSRTLLTEVDARAISKILKKIEKWDLVQFFDCKFCPKFFYLMARECDNEVKIVCLDLNRSRQISIENIKHASNFGRKAEMQKLVLNGCELNEETFTQLAAALGNYKLADLQLNYQVGMNKRYVKKLLELIVNCKTEKLGLLDCNLQDQFFDFPEKRIVSVASLELSLNPLLQFSGDLAGLLSRCLKHLTLRECNLNYEKMEHIEASCKKVQIEHLDISYNPSIEKEAIEQAARIVQKCKVKSLAFAGCQLDLDKTKGLFEALKGAELTYLDLSDNPDLCEKSMKLIGSSVQSKVSIDTLDMSRCQLSMNMLKVLGDILSKDRLEMLVLEEPYKNVKAKTILRSVQALRCSAQELRLQLGCCYGDISQLKKDLKCVGNITRVYLKYKTEIGNEEETIEPC